MKSTPITVPYSDQHAYLTEFLAEHDPQGALLLYAELLREMAAKLDALVGIVGDRPVEIWNDDYDICIKAEDELIDRLVEAGLAHPDDVTDLGDEEERPALPSPRSR